MRKFIQHLAKTPQLIGLKSLIKGAGLTFLGTLLSPLIFVVPAFAAVENPVVPLSPPPGAIGTDVKVENLPQFVINLIFIIGIVIAVVFLIYGGIRWVLSGGDKTKVEESRNHIVAAIVGLIIIVAAFFIIQLVFTLLGQTNPLSSTFKLPSLKVPNP